MLGMKLNAEIGTTRVNYALVGFVVLVVEERLPTGHGRVLGVDCKAVILTCYVAAFGSDQCARLIVASVSVSL